MTAPAHVILPFSAPLTRWGRAAVAVALALAVVLAPAGVGADDEAGEEPEEALPLSACEQLTPPDAPFGCVEVIPPGASAWVTLDGTQLGLSPVAAPELQSGSHTIRLDRIGDAPWVRTFIVEPGQIIRFTDDLAPLPRIVPPPGPAQPNPFAVMVENAADARPQIGLDRADVVYEALAEGGISRFLALYITRDADTIGPVRSTRHYFVYTAAEFNATLVHVGASPIGYAALSATGIRNVNESWGDAGIWRSASRYAPHDAFTSTADASAAADAKGPPGGGSWGPLLFKSPGSGTASPAAWSINIDYPVASYQVAYSYDADANLYYRYMEGAGHRDGATGELLTATNVVVQFVPDEVIDREGRLDLAQTGVGRALYFVDGTVTEGSWTKADYGSQTFFWDTAGNKIRLNPGGTTWIQLVPAQARVTYS